MKTVCAIFFTCIFLSAGAQPGGIDTIISIQSIKHTVSALAHDSMQGRFTGTPEAEKAASFIGKRFAEAGLVPVNNNKGYFSYYPVQFEQDGKGFTRQAINVMAAIPGKINPDTMVIFCAHFDHIGKKQGIKNGRDSVFNGANDNASGVAVLIELAKYYKAIQGDRYTLLFIAFSGEELGLLGSKYLAAEIDQSFVKAVINFDMLGRPLEGMTKKCMVITEKRDGLIKKLNEELKVKKDFFIPDQYPFLGFFSRSDHFSFSQVKNRVFFTSGSDLDGYYHALKDEYKIIDFDFLLRTTHNIAAGCKIFID